MASRVRMLVWEECRTGGIISVVALITGIFALGYIRMDASFGQWQYLGSAVNWNYIGNSVMDGMVTPALVLAVSLVFGLGNSGNLSGGFSNRVLRLPVATRVAVAVPLVMRTTLLVALLFALHWLSRRWFGNAPPLGYPVFVVEVYLLLQLLDWTRKVVSGLVTFVFLPLAAIVFTVALRHRPSEIVDLVANGALFQPLTAVVLLAGVYVLGVPLVHAARTGRRWGAPEIWEWPLRLPWPALTGAARFPTPQAALMWRDWRRVSRYLLLIFVGLIVPSVAPLLLGVVIPEAQSLYPPQSPYLLLRALPGMALLVACLMVGLMGALRRHGTAGYPYVLPVTVQDIARARLMANGRVFALLLGVMVLCSFATGLLGGGRPLALFLETWRAGELYLQDIVWFFMAPAVGAGLIGWAALAVTTRLIGRYAAACLALIGALSLLQMDLEDLLGAEGTPLFAVGIVALSLSAWLDTWRRGLVSWRTVAAAAGGWIALSVLALPRDFLGPYLDARTLLTVAALGALGPLPFVALIRDIARIRHGGLPKRRMRGASKCGTIPSEARHERRRDCPSFAISRFFVTGKRAARRGQTRPLLRRWVSPALLGHLTWSSATLPCAASPEPVVMPSVRGISVTPSARARWIAAIVALVFLAWLKWPAEPAYMATWRAQGYPATMEDVANAQPPVPDAQNKLLAYLDVERQLEARRATYFEGLPIPQDEVPPPYQEDLLYEKGLPYGRMTIGERSWMHTREYHAQVVAPIIPALHELAGRDDMAVSWPMEDGRWPIPEHDPDLLQGALQMDVVVWAMENDPEGAATSLHALMALADVWATRPYSGHLYGRELAQPLEQVLIRVVLPEPLLVDLSHGFEAAMAKLPWERIVAEQRVRVMRVLTRLHGTVFSPGQAPPVPTPPVLWRLAVPLPWDAAVAMRLHGTFLKGPDMVSVERAEREVLEAVRHFQAFFAEDIYVPFTPTVFHHEQGWLMTARIALAAERYRLSRGHFPKRISDLMPQYIEERDLVFFGSNPLECRVTPQGIFEIYARDAAVHYRRLEGDVLFRLPPPAAREAARRVLPDAPEVQEMRDGV